MSAARFDPAEHGRIAALAILQLRQKLEAMPRHHAIVVVGGEDQRWRILHARLEVVVWRVLEQHLEVLFLIRRAVIVDPESPGGEFVETQHIHDAHVRQARAEQVGPLRHRCSDQ